MMEFSIKAGIPPDRIHVIQLIQNHSTVLLVCLSFSFTAIQNAVIRSHSLKESQVLEQFLKRLLQHTLFS